MNRLKELRKEKGLTQQGLADDIGVHFRTLQNWENGKADIKSDKAQQLAVYFDVPVAYLLGYTDSKVIPLDEYVEHFITKGTVKDGITYIGQKDLIQNYQELNSENQKLLEDFADFLKARQKPKN